MGTGVGEVNPRPAGETPPTGVLAHLAETWACLSAFSKSEYSTAPLSGGRRAGKLRKRPRSRADIDDTKMHRGMRPMRGAKKLANFGDRT